MRKMSFRKIVALLLALLMLASVGTVAASAAEGSSVTTRTLDELRELLNANSYKKYQEQYSNVPRVSKDDEIVIDALESYEFVDKNGNKYNQNSKGNESNDDIASAREYDGQTGLYLPGSGTVTWTTDKITTAAKYSMVIKYYPVENKSSTIERILLINGKVPFAEARYINISKVWSNPFTDGEFALSEGENADTYIEEAKKIGITAEKAEISGVTYIKYKMPQYWTNDIESLITEKNLRFFTIDIDLNEIRNQQIQTPVWSTYEFTDSNGFYADSFEFVLAPGEDELVRISLEGINEPVVISSISLVRHEDNISYADYAAQYAGEKKGTDVIKFEAEYFANVSSQTIYPVEDKSSAITSPSATDRTLLNAVGGEKWQTAGQWITYTFKVSESGMYSIASRFKQNVLEGMYTSRSLYLYSGNGVESNEKGYYDGLPFVEASRIKFSYSNSWQSEYFGEDKTVFEFYFEKDVVYTMKLEVSLGSMGDIVSRVQESLDSINKDYLEILKLTGSKPDENRDYNFFRLMPEVVLDLIYQSQELYSISKELSDITGVKGSMAATLDKVARVVEKMGYNENEIANNLEALKTYIGTLGTWLGDAKNQPLMVDLFVIQASDSELPAANAGFFKAAWYEIVSFVKSFFRNYNRMGAMENTKDGEAIEVWMATGRDQSQVVRSLINNDFTPNTDIAVNLKLVAGGTLLPSILSGMGPDVYIGLAQADVINYAIRGALIEIEDMEGFDDAVNEFNEAAMMVLRIADANNEKHYYGLPETQNFSMMFIREDIFAELKIEIPKTWDDILAAIPVLQSNNMDIGMHADVKIFLYQKGGELFADDGMRIYLDSNVALDAFETMCKMFTMYSFPYSYNFANRFRTGEMPIGFADYASTYNHLKVFATELEGDWGFYPLPGYYREDGTINNVAVSTVSAIVMITGADNPESSWEFMKWHAGEECQIAYSNEMITIIGPSGKHPTANKKALASLPWNATEFAQLEAQFYNLASVPNYPGSYIIDRYTKFAYLDVMKKKVDAAEEILKYIMTINSEITRKRQEFGLETLEAGQTLAEKRIDQARAELTKIKSSSSYSSSYDTAYNNAMKAVSNKRNDDIEFLRSAADALETANSSVFKQAIQYMIDAADALQSYIVTN